MNSKRRKRRIFSREKKLRLGEETEESGDETEELKLDFGDMNLGQGLAKSPSRKSNLEFDTSWKPDFKQYTSKQLKQMLSELTVFELYDLRGNLKKTAREGEDKDDQEYLRRVNAAIAEKGIDELMESIKELKATFNDYIRDQEAISHSSEKKLNFAILTCVDAQIRDMQEEDRNEFLSSQDAELLFRLREALMDEATDPELLNATRNALKAQPLSVLDRLPEKFQKDVKQDSDAKLRPGRCEFVKLLKFEKEFADLPSSREQNAYLERMTVFDLYKLRMTAVNEGRGQDQIQFFDKAIVNKGVTEMASLKRAILRSHMPHDYADFLSQQAERMMYTTETQSGVQKDKGKQKDIGSTVNDDSYQRGSAAKVMKEIHSVDSTVKTSAVAAGPEGRKETRRDIRNTDSQNSQVKQKIHFFEELERSLSGDKIRGKQGKPAKEQDGQEEQKEDKSGIQPKTP
jgi:hypothetical protein